jgi:hypothetical protein
MDTQTTYIIAVKRERRGAEPADWREQISRMRGVSTLSMHGPRVRVRASDEAAERLFAQWSEILHIEKEIAHKSQSALVT